jgi:hypothetical protein
MVSSIVTGTTSANPLGVDGRYPRAATGAAQSRDGAAVSNDRVQVSDAAAWAASRDSVANGLSQLDLAMAAGREAQTMLMSAQSATSQDDLDALMQNYQSDTASAVAGGAVLVGGNDISVQAEPGAPPLTVAGANLELGADDSVIQLGSAQVGDPALQQNVQTSLDQVQAMMQRYSDAARGLEAHQGFLGAVDQSGAAVSNDLDADGARLLALQVRQGLQGAGAIANVEPQAVLSLFRA